MILLEDKMSHKILMKEIIITLIHKKNKGSLMNQPIMVLQTPMIEGIIIINMIKETPIRAIIEGILTNMNMTVEILIDHIMIEGNLKEGTLTGEVNMAEEIAITVGDHMTILGNMIDGVMMEEIMAAGTVITIGTLITTMGTLPEWEGMDTMMAVAQEKIYVEVLINTVDAVHHRHRTETVLIHMIILLLLMRRTSTDTLLTPTRIPWTFISISI